MASKPTLAELQRLAPAELLIEDSIDHPEILVRNGVRRRPVWEFEIDTAQRLLTQQFNTHDLQGFGCAHLVGRDSRRWLSVELRARNAAHRDAAYSLDRSRAA